METKQTFLEISPEECLKIYPEVAKNASEFFNVAQVLAGAKYYGKAISNLILGTEEYIKSFCLFLEGNDFELRKIKGVKNIFNGHTARHNIIRDSYSVWMVVKHFYTSYDKSTKSNLLQNTLRALATILPAMSNHDWWKDADKLKQKGLYADYQNKLLLPADLIEEDYIIALRFTQPIPREINEFIQRINRMSLQELKNFRNIFREADFESLIAESIPKK